MRRYAFILLFLVLLIAPLLLQRAMGVKSDAALAAPGGRKLVIISPHNQDIRREFARAFARWHQAKYGSPADLDYRSIGGTNDIKRLLQTTYDGYRDPSGKLKPPDQINVGYDVVWGGGDNFFDSDLKPLGILVPLDASVVREAIPQPTLAGTKLYDYTPNDLNAPIRWAGVCLSSFGIVYNPDLIHALGLPDPRTWADLAVPQLSGAVALADPTHSGSAAVAYMMVLQRSMADAEDAFFAQGLRAALRKTPKDKWPPEAAAAYNAAIAAGWKDGMRMMVLIAANSRYFTDSAERVPTDVGNGDAAAGMAIDFYGRVEEATVGPDRARFVAPHAATATTPDPVAVLYGTTGDRLTLANHFVEFLLSRDGQKLWIQRPGTPGGPERRELGRPPIRRDLYADQSDWSDRVDPFTDAGSFNLRGAWMATFGEVRPIWAAAWIDDRDALRDAYRRILAVPDESRRAALLAALADLPVEMKDVLASAAAKKQAGPSADAGVRDAKSRMDWAGKFRDHYAAVAARATP